MGQTAPLPKQVGVPAGAGVVGPSGPFGRQARFAGLPPEHKPEQQSTPSVQDSSTLAKVQTTGLPVGPGVGLEVGCDIK